MAIYMANKILTGERTYTEIFRVPVYKRLYQADVDTILILEGRADLIVTI